jgi:hypothetical protein
MLSFISTFKNKRKARLAKACAAFLCLFLVFFLSGLWIQAQRPQWTHQDPLPPGGQDWDLFSRFLAHGETDTNNALYYGLGPMISRARKADVLVVGNSRPFFTFREDSIEAAEKQSGLSFFSLAGPGDNFPFTRDILLRNHLFPRILIVNEDQFFNPKLWPFQKEVMTGSWWHAWSSTTLNYYRWLGAFTLRKFIPELVFFKLGQGKEHYTLCSPADHFMILENISGGHYPVREEKKKSTPDPQTLEMARPFIEEMRKRGCRVVLTFVPNGQNTAFIKEEARELGVPCVLPSLKGLETFDGKHLTPESSARFAKAFFELFFKLPEVREVFRESRGIEKR